LKKVALLATAVLLVRSAKAQSVIPSVYQVLGYSAMPTQVPWGYPTGGVLSVFSETVPDYVGSNTFNGTIHTATNYKAAQNLLSLESAINAGIASALSIVPLSSPASGVILRTDPKTQAELPESSTLGTIFTERAETIGKHQWYIGFSHQDSHFARFNGMDLNTLSLLYTGGYTSGISLSKGASPLATVPATFQIGMNVHLSQDITFLTFGITDRIDVSAGVPVVHTGVAASTYDPMIYAGNGTHVSPNTCWCVNTLTPGVETLQYAGAIGYAGLSKTGLGDLLFRGKGTVVRKRNMVVAVGTDLRLPTGNETNLLGTGTTSVKPFMAVSLYSKPVRSLVFSPHFDLGWQFSGKSILAGELQTVQLGQTSPVYYGAGPGGFTATKDFIPDVFSWAAGTEVALGHHNTLIFDFLGNQIGWIHGILNVVNTPDQAYAPTAPFAQTKIAGFVGVNSMGLPIHSAYGQYSGSLGYKARIAGNLVANLSVLYRFDNNGLVARVVPAYGLSYTFGESR